MSSDNKKILICTWNAGNAPPSKLDAMFADKTNVPDIIVCGLQESTWGALGEVAVMQKAWESAIGPDFELAQHLQRAQLQLFIFAKKDIKNEISHIETSAENTGLLGIYPNKGGILITFKIRETSIAFVSCHLTAHEGVHHCEQRNDSIAEILEGAKVKDTRYDITSQFHHIFWMGDMNYRTAFSKEEPKSHRAVMSEAALKQKEELMALSIAKENEDQQDEEVHIDRLGEMKMVYKLIDDGQWAEIAKLDELNRELAADRTLIGFTALQPSFPPTFKRNRNICITKDASGNYCVEFKSPELLELKKKKKDKSDKASEEKAGGAAPTNEVAEFYDIKRIPSYTDRILFKSLPAFVDNVRPLFFKSCEEIDSSDHKPVYAMFDLKTTDGIHGIVRNGDSGDLKDSFRLAVVNMRGFDLEPLDMNGKSDPYVLISSDPCELFSPIHSVNTSCCLPLTGFFSRLMAPTASRYVMDHEIKSSVVPFDLNPVWNYQLECDIGSTDIDGLIKHAHLTFGVWDEDKTNEDDVIGNVLISFKEIFEGFAKNNSTSYDFDKKVLINGVYRGRLTGSIRTAEPVAAIRARHATLKTK